MVQANVFLALALSSVCVLTGNKSQPRLSITGRVENILVARESSRDVHLEVRVAVTVTNLAETPVIVVSGYPQPIAHELFSDEALRVRVYESYYYPSRAPGDRWRRMRDGLDTARPIDGPTVTLGYGKSTVVRPTLDFHYMKTPESPVDELWERVRLKSPVWLQVTLEFWPLNVSDTSRRGFDREIQARWRPWGDVVIERMKSDPIRLDWTVVRPR